MNNPFVNANDPSHASSRFPDISGSSTSYFSQTPQQQGQWTNGGSSYQQPSGYGQQFQQQQQYGQQGFGGNSGFLSPTGSTMQGQYGGSQFQPTSPYGQQSGPVMSGTSYSYLSAQSTNMPQQQQQQQPQQQLGPAQQQIANNPGYVAQFDPYGPLSQWDGTGGQNQQQQQQYQQQSQQQQSYQSGGYSDNSGYLIPPTGTPSGTSPSGDPHPREFIRTHKALLDKWDSHAWKQLLNTFEALKNAWGSRKTACSTQVDALRNQMNYAGYYQQQVQAELQRVQELLKDADIKFDSVAASTFQMQEVFEGYHQSPDISSKARVREATNAALNSLPDWPPSSI